MEYRYCTVVGVPSHALPCLAFPHRAFHTFPHHAFGHPWRFAQRQLLLHGSGLSHRLTLTLPYMDRALPFLRPNFLTDYACTSAVRRVRYEQTVGDIRKAVAEKLGVPPEKQQVARGM